jgi:hypothetical protein
MGGPLGTHAIGKGLKDFVVVGEDGQVGEHTPEPTLEQVALRHGRYAFRKPARSDSVMSSHFFSLPIPQLNVEPGVVPPFNWSICPSSLWFPQILRVFLLVSRADGDEFGMNFGRIRSNFGTDHQKHSVKNIPGYVRKDMLKQQIALYC